MRLYSTSFFALYCSHICECTNELSMLRILHQSYGILNFENMTGEKAHFAFNNFLSSALISMSFSFRVNSTSPFCILRSHACLILFFRYFLLNYIWQEVKKSILGLDPNITDVSEVQVILFFDFHFFLLDMKTTLVPSQVFGINLLINNHSKTVKNWPNFYSPLKTSRRMCLFSLILLSFLSFLSVIW